MFLHFFIFHMHNSRRESQPLAVSDLQLISRRCADALSALASFHKSSLWHQWCRWKRATLRCNRALWLEGRAPQTMRRQRFPRPKLSSPPMK